jgi:hypothetical protein
MGVAKSFRDMRVYQHDWSSITSMLARMIDRASDFCKYSADTNYREAVNEDPWIADDIVLRDFGDPML